MQASNAGSKPTFVGAVEDEWQMYSDNAEDYSISSPIGFGASSIVYLAYYSPRGKGRTPCALKVLDLDVLAQKSLRLLVRETQLMSLSKHPNVLRVRGSWIEGQRLHIALRLMNRGSAADIMRYAWPGGMEEDVVRCILKQALQGLHYLHVNGFIHRDVKAANLLIDDDGTVLLGDLGVAASLSDDDSFPGREARRTLNFNPTEVATSATPATKPTARGKRKSFVGTPCWMAPEIIAGKQYDASADIWSFGITAIELTQGRAPRSREAPHKVLLKTVQEPPPVFDRDSSSHHYSKGFKDLVDRCLVKDPASRPSTEDLLQSAFFKGAKKKGYLVNAILEGLPPLVDRQERRRQPSHPTRSSIDSWDFTILASPTSSVGRRPRSNLIPNAGGVFALEGDPSEEPPAPDSPVSAGEGDFSNDTDEVEGADDRSSSASSPREVSTAAAPSIPIPSSAAQAVQVISSPLPSSSPSAASSHSASSSVPSSSSPGRWKKFSDKSATSRITKFLNR